MSDDKKVVFGKIDAGGLALPFWMIGWLFTVGYLHLPTARAILGLVLWPYYLGSFLGK
jgi:hypothetical protein